MTTELRWYPADRGEPMVHRPAYVRVRCCRKQTGEIEQGGIIGRCRTAAFRIKDERLSEAHAMVSVRKEHMVMLGLRRKLLAACGTPRREIPLEVGTVVTLVPEIEITVEDLHVPPTYARVVVDERPPVPLFACSQSIVLEEDGLHVQGGYNAKAVGFLMWRAGGWTAMFGAGELRRIRSGDRLVVGEHVLRFEEVPLSVEVHDQNSTGFAEFEFPLRVVVRYDTVHLHRADRTSLVISGTAARIVGELVRFGVPVDWEMAARQIWTDGKDRALLRKNWDRHLGLLRKKLRDARFPDDLVRPDGCGNVEIFVREGDQVIDQT